MSWKDILRPIRDRLRDNPPQPGKFESNEDKRKRQTVRADDALKGFVYIEDFDELDQWRADHIEPHQISSTPLLKRPSCCTENKGKSGVALIHDYSGNDHS
ncbi:Hypothetical protein D9617_5g070980 [Elsinoe fawcettii]|nr:Hypothetical protein D9617_5g070980 [Elsinoe fawcettii]